MTSAKGVLSLLWLFAAASLFSQAPAGRLVTDEPGYTVRCRVDWAAGSLDVEVSHQLDPSAPTLPRAKGDAESDIQSRLGAFLVSSISTIPVDSSHSYGNLLQNDPALFARVSAVTASIPGGSLSLSEDFSRLIARYQIPLFGAQGIASPLFPSRSVPVPRMLGWVPTRPFSGLLIYARGKLPMAGSANVTSARPALFPRIFDEDMTLVLDKSMVSPEALARWGMVGYAAGLEDEAALVRGGALPLRVVARGVFGDNNTDIVIPSDGARRLLTLPENRALLRDGRIVIVLESLE